MTRIMCWNVQKFGINKIANPSNGREPGTTIGGRLRNTTVRNGIVGSPYADWPDLAVEPIGTYQFPLQTADDQFRQPGRTAPGFTIDRRTAFVNWDNYRRIRSTGDHLVVAADL